MLSFRKSAKTEHFLQTNKGKVFKNSIFLYIYISAHLYL